MSPIDWRRYGPARQVLFGRPGWAFLAVLPIWMGVLATVGDLPAAGVWVLAAEAAGLWFLMGGMAPDTDKQAAQRVFALALLAYTVEILIVRTVPFWSDTFPDSARYDSNARALVLHWRGLPVPAAEFRLYGLEVLGIAHWLPGDDYPYADVFGMSRYLYQLYVAGIYALTGGSRSTAVLGNALFLAGSAAGVYLLAQTLFRKRSITRLATVLMVLDLNFAVFGSVLLREALLIFLIVLALLGFVRLLGGGENRLAGLLSAMGGSILLAVLRFNAVAALAAAGFCVVLCNWKSVPSRFKRLLVSMAALGLLLVVSILATPSLKAFWETSLPGQILAENLRISKGAKPTLNAIKGQWSAEDEAHVERSRQRWHRDLREQPAWLNIKEAIWRSLMAPYPWSFIRHGIPGESFYELMIPGSLLWVVLMPLFFFAFVGLRIRGDPAVQFCLVWLLVETAIYIIGFGEFSMRQRMMAQPLLWIFVACGASDLLRRLSALRSVGSERDRQNA